MDLESFGKKKKKKKRAGLDLADEESDQNAGNSTKPFFEIRWT